MDNDDKEIENSGESSDFRDYRSDFNDDFGASGIDAEPDFGDTGTAKNTSQAGANRLLLKILLGIVGIAVVLAIWSLIGSGRSKTNADEAGPTPVAVPTSTPTPTHQEPTPTPVPTVQPTALPQGFRACEATQMPKLDTKYVVDTNTTPLKQRRKPSVQGDLAGSYPPAQADLNFTGECVYNEADGLVWWSINNGSEVIWVAAKFVTPAN